MLDVLTYALVGALVLILIVCLSIATYSGSQFLDTYKSLKKRPASSFTVASDFVLKASIMYAGSRVKLAKKSGEFGDCYQPKSKAIVLCEETYSSSSIASLTVASHEMGHALQDIENPQMLLKKHKFSKLSKTLGRFMMPSFVVGLLFLIFSKSIVYSACFFAFSIAIFVFALVVKGMQIKIEKDASKRALKLLKQMQMLDEEELKLSKKLLSDALLTYVADLLQAVLGWTLLTRKTKIFGD